MKRMSGISGTDASRFFVPLDCKNVCSSSSQFRMFEITSRCRQASGSVFLYSKHCLGNVSVTEEASFVSKLTNNSGCFGKTAGTV